MAANKSQGTIVVSTGNGINFSRPRDGSLVTDTSKLTVQPPEEIDQSTIIVSQQSVVTYHSTLFEDFNLTTDPVYNFYVSDEQVNSQQDELIHLCGLPRYISISWNTAPQQRIMFQSRKGQRPVDSRKSTVPDPVLKVSVAKKSLSNGFIRAGSIAALLVPPLKNTVATKFNEDAFLTSDTAAGKSAAENLHSTAGFHSVSLPTSNTRTRLNLVDPSIAGVVDPNRIAAANDHTHLAVLGSVSKLLSSLEVVSEFNQDVAAKNPPPKFPAPQDSATLLYTGYTIERYTLGSDGSMTLTRTIDIDGASNNSFTDRQVLFNVNYVYRISAIVQWTRDSNIGFAGISLLNKIPAFDASAGRMSKIASFYSGPWSDWTRTQITDNSLPDPPDELTVRPISKKNIVDVVWKMPNNPQLDISAVRLLRSKISSNGVSDWVLLGEFAPTNGRYVDRDVKIFSESHTQYMYAMYSVSFHGEHSMLSEKLAAKLGNDSKYTDDEPITQIGAPGDDPFTHASGQKQKAVTELIAKNTATLYIRGGPSSVQMSYKNYVLEVQSISTGERVEIGVNVDSIDVV